MGSRSRGRGSETPPTPRPWRARPARRCRGPPPPRPRVESTEATAPPASPGSSRRPPAGRTRSPAPPPHRVARARPGHHPPSLLLRHRPPLIRLGGEPVGASPLVHSPQQSPPTSTRSPRAVAAAGPSPTRGTSSQEMSGRLQSQTRPATHIGASPAMRRAAMCFMSRAPCGPSPGIGDEGGGEECEARALEQGQPQPEVHAISPEGLRDETDRPVAPQVQQKQLAIECRPLPEGPEGREEGKDRKS